MELSEVVTLQVAVPVVGVVVFAVLVFAFGFKSPVQPPSFDYFETDERKHSRKPKQKKKSPSNGHVVNIDQGSPASSSARQPQNKQQVAPPSAKPAAPAHEKHDQLTVKAKVKKTTGSKAPVTGQQETAPRQDDGGWTTVSVSKRDKKKRSQKEVDEPVGANWKETPQTSGRLQLEQDNSSTAQPQRTKKEKVSPRPSKAKKEPSPEKIQPAGDSSDKENIPEPQSTPQQVSGVKPVEDAPKEGAPKAAASPKKKKKAAKAAPVQEVAVEDIASSQDAATTPVAPVKSTPTEVQQTTAAADAATGVEKSKPAKSPKKSKKSKNKQQAEESAVTSSAPSEDASQSPGVHVASATEGSTSGAAAAAAASSISSSAPSQSSQSTQDTTQSTGAAGSSSGVHSEAPPATSEQQPSVSFDEMGATDWQEAKPIRRKKKIRRDN